MSKRKPAPPSAPEPPPLAQEFRLARFDPPVEDLGLSLDELSQTYAALFGGGDDPYQAAPPPDEGGGDGPSLESLVADVQNDPDLNAPLDDSLDDPLDDLLDPRPTAPTVDHCDITPRTILEAMLFVGHSANEPLSGQAVASLMRGVTAQEVAELVEELNETYESEAAPYWIESVGAGYRLALRPELVSLRDKFYGRVKEARLTQANIDVLAVVAYNQPLTRNDVDRLRGRPSGAVLSQLVRRELLRIDRPADDPRTSHFHTTDRFLQLFGLESLDDLPRTQDTERS